MRMAVYVRRWLTLCLVTMLAIVGVVTIVPTAVADEFTATVFSAPGWEYANIRSEPNTNRNPIEQIPAGQTVTLVCYQYGSEVQGPYGASNLWYKVQGYDSGWVADVMVYTGSDEPVTEACAGEQKEPSPQQTKASIYNRYGAAMWAVEYADTFHPLLGADCTYFVSRSLWYGGGISRTDVWTDSSSDQSKWVARKWPMTELVPGVTRVAANANDFVNYMRDSGMATVTEISWSDNTAAGAQLGDIIAYDWDNGADGVIDHVAIVTRFTTEGYPFVTQHSPWQINRYWSYYNSEDKWIEEAIPGSKAYLVHIIV